jgi:hypothetical protein
MSAPDAERYLARLESVIAGLERDARQAERELAESQERRAQDAREGRMGRDWQDVQRRIDAGQTSLRDVFSGRDDSTAAQRLAQLSRENLSRMAAEAEPPEDVVEELAAAEAQWDRVRAADRTGGLE